MKFWVAIRQITITGDPSLAKAMVSCKSMLKLCQKEDTSFLVHMNATEISSPNPLPPQVIQKVLERFKPIFHMPTGLPPHSNHEHAITLHEHEGTTPRN